MMLQQSAVGKIRIGIDVGGTFTHAAALDDATYTLIAQSVTPTTHSSKYSVAEGVITVFQDVLKKSGCRPEDVVFVAHSTTQATNALLEGDVAKVGIIGMGHGLEALRAKSGTSVPDIRLSSGKTLQTASVYLDSGSASFSPGTIDNALQTLIADQCKVIVASEAFGVDNTADEQLVSKEAEARGLPATTSSDISQLYGLRVRTRTAVINASILPRMSETAQLTDESIKKSGITAPLMIMRSDGGVMNMEQMKKRPVNTLLSGPAAGVAAALMYVRISDGIFLEVGGTSTDITAIKNGRAAIKSAVIGGYTTFLKTLDVHTVGIGGGSMIRIKKDGTILEVGPRSAHIAGLPYLSFSSPEELSGAVPVRIAPLPGDPDDYLAMRNPRGALFAVTLTDVALYAGMVKPGDYAYGNPDCVHGCLESAAGYFHTAPELFAERIMDKMSGKLSTIVLSLLSDYALDPKTVSLVGGGGGCAAVIPWVSRKMNMKYRVSQNPEIVSAIGAATAMLRDSVARTVVHPQAADIASIRSCAVQRLIEMGAAKETVEVQIEIDGKRNILQATASGAFKMEIRDFGKKKADKEQLLSFAGEQLETAAENVRMEASTGSLTVFSTEQKRNWFISLMKKNRKSSVVLDSYGVVKLRFADAAVRLTQVSGAAADCSDLIENVCEYTEAGQIVPCIFLLHGAKVSDFSSIIAKQQILDAVAIELDGENDNQPLVLIAVPR